MARRLVGFLLLRNLVLAVFMGLLVGGLAGAVSPVKKGKSQDLAWGISGAVLASLCLAFLRGGVKLGPLLLVQLVGSLILILVGRLFV